MVRRLVTPVVGGSARYVEKVARRPVGPDVDGDPVGPADRATGVEVVDGDEPSHHFDGVVMRRIRTRRSPCSPSRLTPSGSAVGIGYTDNPALLQHRHVGVADCGSCATSWNYAMPACDARPLAVQLSYNDEPPAVLGGSGHLRSHAHATPVWNQHSHPGADDLRAPRLYNGVGGCRQRLRPNDGVIAFRWRLQAGIPRRWRAVGGRCRLPASAAVVTMTTNRILPVSVAHVRNDVGATRSATRPTVFVDVDDLPRLQRALRWLARFELRPRWRSGIVRCAKPSQLFGRERTSVPRGRSASPCSPNAPRSGLLFNRYPAVSGHEPGRLRSSSSCWVQQHLRAAAHRCLRDGGADNEKQSLTYRVSRDPVPLPVGVVGTSAMTQTIAPPGSWHQNSDSG